MADVEDNCVTTTTTVDAEGVTIINAGTVGFGTFPGGVTTVTYTYTDGTGNASTCSFDVTIEDTVDPVINGCPADMSVGTDAGSCDAQVLWQQPNITDNCPGVTYTASHISGATLAAGTTTVRLCRHRWYWKHSNL